MERLANKALSNQGFIFLITMIDIKVIAAGA